MYHKLHRDERHNFCARTTMSCSSRPERDISMTVTALRSFSVSPRPMVRLIRAEQAREDIDLDRSSSPMFFVPVLIARSMSKENRSSAFANLKLHKSLRKMKQDQSWPISNNVEVVNLTLLVRFFFRFCVNVENILNISIHLS